MKTSTTLYLDEIGTLSSTPPEGKYLEIEVEIDWQDGEYDGHTATINNVDIEWFCNEQIIDWVNDKVSEIEMFD